MKNIQELNEYLNASADTYRFLSQLFFKELSEEAIEQLALAEYPQDTGNELLDKGYSLVRRYFKFSGPDRRTQLAVEYARVFLAAGVFAREKRTAVPYESVFTSEEHIMMQESRDDCVRRYLADGFNVNPELHEPEDHLAFQLEYLSEMNVKAAALLLAPGSGTDGEQTLTQHDRAALERNLQRQVEFIDSHLLNWLPELTEVAEAYATLSFYIGMLYVAQGALQQSKAFLNKMLAAETQAA